MSRTPNNATITVSPTKLARAPRNKRLPAPAAKVRENQTQRRTHRATRAQSPLPLQFQDVEDSDDDYEEGNENTATTLEELLVLVKDPKKTIDQQNQSIQEAQTELRELKEEQQHVKERNNELKGEICLLRDQFGTLSASLRSTPSWASIAANRTGPGPTQPTPGEDANDLAKHLPNPLATTDTLHCTIDTSRVAEEDTDKTSPGAIRAVVEKEMRATNGQSNWRCRAVTRDVKNVSRIKIACRDENEQHLIKQTAETNIAAGVRVLRDELYPIKGRQCQSTGGPG